MLLESNAQQPLGYIQKLDDFINVGVQLSQPSDTSEYDRQVELYHQGLAGWNSAGQHTAVSGTKDRNDAFLREQKIISQTSASAAAQIAQSQTLLTDVIGTVENQMRAVRTDIQIAETRQVQNMQQLDGMQDQMEIADQAVNKEGMELFREAEQLSRDISELESAETAIDQAFEQSDVAANSGRYFDIVKSATGINTARDNRTQRQEDVAEQETVVLEEQEDFIQASEMRASVQEQIDTLTQKITDGGTNLEDLHDQLDELTTFNTYLNSDEAQELAANGKLTMETLQANGMPESIRFKMEEASPSMAHSEPHLRESVPSIEGGIGEET